MYSRESRALICAKSGASAAGEALSEYVPPVFWAMLLSAAGSYCFERRPTEMTLTFASSSAASASARLASEPTSVPSERRTTVVRWSPDSSASSDARMSAS